jgi:hypothetical protein
VGERRRGGKEQKAKREEGVVPHHQSCWLKKRASYDQNLLKSEKSLKKIL